MLHRVDRKFRHVKPQQSGSRAACFEHVRELM